jgi:hypothetical protein
MRRECWAVIAAAVLFASTGRAEVYEWRDDSGARHFTNSMQGVPAEYQTAVRVVVADWDHPAALAPADAPVPPPPAPPAAAQVVSDNSALDEAYAAGMRAAQQFGGGGGGGGGVQINGPLAVATNRTSDSAGVPYGFYPPWPWYYPLVTTGFDRGRSRHQTIRMLLQDQFAIDRDGPFAYQRWDQPGLGPALAPFLSRGLPYGVSQYGRVIYR